MAHKKVSSFFIFPLDIPQTPRYNTFTMNDVTNAARDLAPLLRYRVSRICHLPLRDEMISELRAGGFVRSYRYRELCAQIAKLGDDAMRSALNAFNSRPADPDMLAWLEGAA